MKQKLTPPLQTLYERLSESTNNPRARMLLFVSTVAQSYQDARNNSTQISQISDGLTQNADDWATLCVGGAAGSAAS